MTAKITGHLRSMAAVYIMALLFTGGMFTLQVLQHNAFNSRIGDFARFSQAIWSVLDGRLLYSTIPGRSILGDHFSPIMVIAAPLLLVWPNERVLFLVQAVNVAATGIILALIMRDKRPAVVPFFALAYFLNANVHTFTLIDFRRITFGLPFFALALLGLSRNSRRLLLIGLLLALTAKETFGIEIAAVGLYLLFVERDWKWGGGLIALGGALTVLLSEYVIPAFSGGVSYPQLFYFSHLGDSYVEIAQTMLTEPQRVLALLLGQERLFALFKTALPLGFLFLLAPGYALIYGPYLCLALLSSRDTMYLLDEHYTAVLIPILFAALAAGWARLAPRWDRPLVLILLVGTIAGYALFSPAPLGGRYQPERFDVNDHDRAGMRMARLVPEEARLLAQTHYTPHLTHVDDIDVFLPHHDGLPFSAERVAAVDYIFIDRTLSQEPLGLLETELIVQNMLADPNMKIVAENDGIFFFEKTTSDHPALPLTATYEQAMRLERVELAVSDEDGFFVPHSGGRLQLIPGQQIRVSLFWQAIDATNLGERTISVRLAAADGFLLSQQDHIPAEGVRPTSWWSTGDRIRDVHYLTVPATAAAQTASIDLVVYDTYDGTIIQPDAQQVDVLPLTPIDIIAE